MERHPGDGTEGLRDGFGNSSRGGIHSHNIIMTNHDLIRLGHRCNEIGRFAAILGF